jgi:hypothetical protein
MRSYKSLSFEQLKKLDYSQQNQDIRITGFLYAKGDDTWILAAEPNLRSCCVGSKNKINQQVHIEGQFNGENSPFAGTLQGHFFIDPVYDEKGDLIQLYHLTQVQRIPRDSFLPKGFALLILMLTLIAAKKWFQTLFQRRGNV